VEEINNVWGPARGNCIWNKERRDPERVGGNWERTWKFMVRVNYEGVVWMQYREGKIYYSGVLVRNMKFPVSKQRYQAEELWLQREVQRGGWC
jgi:hypothetical protein